MNLASRIRVPDGCKALLLDLDGVIVDTLTIEYDLLTALLARHAPIAFQLDRELVRTVFPYPIPEAWQRILVAVGRQPDPELVEILTQELEGERSSRAFPLHDGIGEIVRAARELELRVAVVSNNPISHIEEVLNPTGLRSMVDVVVGNDRPGMRSKPAPDTYLAAASGVGFPTERCVAIEDSLLGAQSASDAGCHVIGVATGAATFGQLSASRDVATAYERFSLPVIRLVPGDVTRKLLVTPTEFVSHMVEAVAWRLGCEVHLEWYSDDWCWLGQELGRTLAPLLDGASTSMALGMIDDGSCEVYLERARPPELAIVGLSVDVDWFVSLRCEQLSDGKPLVDMLRGLAEGAGLYIRVDVASLEDPHHTWEAVWRGFGLALRGLSRTLTDAASGASRATRHARAKPERLGYGFASGLDVLASGPETASVKRATAESACEVELTFDQAGFACQVETADGLAMGGLAVLLDQFAHRAGLGGVVHFRTLRLSSSHVVAEDIGMTLGAALRVLAIERMHAYGIECAGSSMLLSHHPKPVRVGVSFEGRKFMKFVPIGWDYPEFRRQLIGRTLSNGLFSEDLDDFLDGLAGGMACSVVIHWERLNDPDQGWRLIFEGLGHAVADVLAVNRTRQGLISGVKATLA